MNINKEILPDNPAARLLSILTKALDTEFDETTKSREAWSQILGVNNSPSELFDSYAKPFTLTQNAYTKVIGYYPNQIKTHSGWKYKIDDCLTTNSPYHHNWNQVKTNLQKPGLMDMLQVAADNLSHFVAPTTISELSIEELKQEFSVLKDMIQNSESLSDQLKYFLFSGAQ